MWVTVRSGDARGTMVELNGAPMVLGRSDDNDLVLADHRVSRRHAELAPLGDGTYSIRDLGSGNGTLVNGERVATHVLKGGEQLQLGDTILATSRDKPGSNGGDTVLGQGTEIRSQSALHRLVLQRSIRRATVLSGVAIVAVLGVVVLVAVGAFSGGGGSGSSASVERVISAAAPSTVVIDGTRAGGSPVSGSGWVLDAGAGLIVTNAHVINDAEHFRAGIAGHLQPATVVAAAPCEDLAVLRVPNTAGLRTMPLGNQASLRLGESVVALGYPQTASRRADLNSTTGVVSVTRSVYREAALDIPRYPNVVQTDAAINPGSSGGPLLDLNGRLVGVNSAGRTITPGGRIVQGQNYAIGVDRVRQIVRTLRTGHSLGWTGLGFDYPSPNDAAAPTGLVAGHAVAGTAAAAVPGLAGSIIDAVNGHAVGTSLAGWCSAVAGLRSGSTATLTVRSPGAVATRSVTMRMQ